MDRLVGDGADREPYYVGVKKLPELLLQRQNRREVTQMVHKRFCFKITMKNYKKLFKNKKYIKLYFHNV